MKIIKKTHDHNFVFKENTKIQKILLILSIVMCSIFISGSGLSAFSSARSYAYEFLEYGTLSSKYHYTFDEKQMDSALNGFSNKGYYIVTYKGYIIFSDTEIYLDIKGEHNVLRNVDRSYLAILRYSSQGWYWIDELREPPVFGDFPEGFSTNFDLKDYKGNVVFRKPELPLINHQLVAVIPEMMVADGSKILPIGLVLLSVGLLIFLLIRWRRSLNL